MKLRYAFSSNLYQSAVKLNKEKFPINKGGAGGCFFIPLSNLGYFVSCSLLILFLFILSSCNSLYDVKGGITHRYVYKGTVLYKYINDKEKGDSIGVVDRTELASFTQYLNEFWKFRDYWKWDYDGRFYYIDAKKTGWVNINLEDSLSRFGKLIVKTLVLEGDKAIEKETMRVMILDTTVNQEGDDYAPAISVDGKTLYYVSQRQGSKLMPGDDEPSHDFWAVTKSKNYDSSFTKPYNIDTTTDKGFKGINTELNEGVATLAADGRTLYFTGCNRIDGIGDCDIYSARIFEGKWSQPLNLDRNVNSSYWDSQPSLSPDGKVLYFASNRPGPNGDNNFDIWYSVWDEKWEEWQPAMNLSAVNTPGKEFAPFIAADGVTLFFSSDGLDSSLGGLDFYVTKYDFDTKNWSAPAHLSQPLNTEYDDQFISMPASGDMIYFSSERRDIPGRQGKLDLFMAYVEAFFRAIVVKLYVADDSGLNTTTTITVENPVSQRKVREKVTGRDNILNMVLTNADYGRISDSLKYVDLNIRADNPRFGSKQKILRIKNPLMSESKTGWLFNNEVEETFEVSVSPELEAYLRSLNRTILDAQVKAYSVISDSTTDTASITIEEFRSSNTKPLLPYVFFDDSSSILPDRYVKMSRGKAERFTNDSLYNLGTLETYHNLLNIIGWRMSQFGDANLVLTGCNSNNNAEKGNTLLSMQRARNVRSYLVSTWGIDSSRITVIARNLPDNPSNGLYDEGIAENRRVECQSPDYRILAPVTTSEILRAVRPRAIDFESLVSVKGGEADWKLTAMQDEDTLKIFSGEGSLSDDLIWDIETETNTLPRTDSPVYFELTVQDKKNDNKIIVAKGSLPVRQITTKRKSSEFTSDKKIDRFSLILFDFGKSRLNDGNMNNILSIKDSVRSDSKVIVKGYTDAMGNEVFNQKLSGKRAEETARALAAKNIETQGIGEGKLLYDNSLPEGRFYCRTVEIIVETPIELSQK